MLCQQCQKSNATVHIDEVHTFLGPGESGNQVEQHHLCETCAQAMELPGSEVQQKPMDEVWKLLQMSALKGKKQAPKNVRRCPSCGTTEDSLRRKGRLGCSECYEVFSDYLEGLLERMHGASTHSGRVPGQCPETTKRQRRIEQAQSELDRAVKDEDFERAAELRDEVQRLTQELDAAADEGSASPS
ncbi:MAG: UvrB/UvrC motif-containing protein [Planctomycetes bacterium]|nr:UvrB/UvrC motif-containing protein [Planctomycetota bacterium]